MGYRVVIGDDESIIRMDLCEMLEDAGHTVVGEAAGTGWESTWNWCVRKRPEHRLIGHQDAAPGRDPCGPDDRP